MQHEDNAFFHVGMKGYISKEGKLLIVRESEAFEDGGKWELPGGRIGHDEVDSPFQDVLRREIAEECGAVRVRIGEIVHVFRRHFANGKRVVLLGFDCEYLEGEIVLSDEHEKYAWISEEDMKKYEFVNGYEEAIRTYFQKKSGERENLTRITQSI